MLYLVCLVLGVILPAHAIWNPPTFQLVMTLKSWDLQNITSWQSGGGKPQNISSDSNHPFAGRQYGGASRKAIRGTRAFGSGYPYGNPDVNTISGRPFPYGVWPLYWGNNIKGSDEYGPSLDLIRPGGPVVVQAIASTTNYWNVSSDETYYMVTDKETAMALMTSFCTWCHATPAWPTLFDPTQDDSFVKIENVFQYYRASSFALAYKGYNNSFALTTNTEASYDQSDPLPDVVEYSSFRRCLDGVVANAIPIIGYQGPSPMSKGDLAATISIPIIAVILIAWCCWANKR